MYGVRSRILKRRNTNILKETLNQRKKCSDFNPREFWLYSHRELANMVSKIPTVQNNCKAERRISRNPSTLIYCMGTEAVQIYKSMSFKKKEDEKEFRRHIKQIWRIFHTDKNVIHEDAKFYLRTRRDVEPIEKFVRGLYELAENCDFPQKNDQIRDHFGLKSKELSEKLQLREDLSLKKAVEIARSNEQVKTQMGEMQDNSMDAITKEKKETTKHTGWEKYPQKAANTSRCKKWNKYHKFNKCPAKGKICRNCDKMNPFAIWCRSLTKNTELRKQPTERYFLGSICKNELPEKKKRFFTCKINGRWDTNYFQNWYRCWYKCYQY